MYFCKDLIFLLSGIEFSWKNWENIIFYQKLGRLEGLDIVQNVLSWHQGIKLFTTSAVVIHFLQQCHIKLCFFVPKYEISSPIQIFQLILCLHCPLHIFCRTCHCTVAHAKPQRIPTGILYIQFNVGPINAYIPKSITTRQSTKHHTDHWVLISAALICVTYKLIGCNEFSWIQQIYLALILSGIDKPSDDCFPHFTSHVNFNLQN